MSQQILSESYAGFQTQENHPSARPVGAHTNESGRPLDVVEEPQMPIQRSGSRAMHNTRLNPIQTGRLRS